MELPEKMPEGFFFPMNKQTKSCNTQSGHTLKLEGFYLVWSHSQALGKWSVLDPDCFEQAYQALRSSDSLSVLFGSFLKGL